MNTEVDVATTEFLNSIKKGDAIQVNYYHGNVWKARVVTVIYIQSQCVVVGNGDGEWLRYRRADSEDHKGHFCISTGKRVKRNSYYSSYRPSNIYLDDYISSINELSLIKQNPHMVCLGVCREWLQQLKINDEVFYYYTDYHRNWHCIKTTVVGHANTYLTVKDASNSKGASNPLYTNGRFDLYSGYRYPSDYKLNYELAYTDFIAPLCWKDIEGFVLAKYELSDEWLAGLSFPQFDGEDEDEYEDEENDEVQDEDEVLDDVDLSFFDEFYFKTIKKLLNQVDDAFNSNNIILYICKNKIQFDVCRETLLFYRKYFKHYYTKSCVSALFYTPTDCNALELYTQLLRSFDNYELTSHIDNYEESREASKNIHSYLDSKTLSQKRYIFENCIKNKLAKEINYLYIFIDAENLNKQALKEIRYIYNNWRIPFILLADNNISESIESINFDRTATIIDDYEYMGQETLAYFNRLNQLDDFGLDQLESEINGAFQ